MEKIKKCSEFILETKLKDVILYENITKEDINIIKTAAENIARDMFTTVKKIKIDYNEKNIPVMISFNINFTDFILDYETSDLMEDIEREDSKYNVYLKYIAKYQNDKLITKQNMAEVKEGNNYSIKFDIVIGNKKVVTKEIPKYFDYSE